MNRNYMIGGAVAVALALGGYLLWPKTEPPAREPERTVVAPVAPAEDNYPVQTADSSPGALPELESSDALLADSAKSLFGSAIDRWLIPTEVVRHVVVTVDNLPRKKYAERQKPLKAVPGRFEVEGGDDNLTLAVSNAARYTAIVDLVQRVDMSKVAKEYFRLYPLFQQAYRDLGYPEGHFNNRLVQAIDDLLAAPQIVTPIKLVRPNVLYEYADPKLESLSAGQKVMIRVGTDNQAKLKAKLRELRAAVVVGK